MKAGYFVSYLPIVFQDPCPSKAVCVLYAAASGREQGNGREFTDLQRSGQQPEYLQGLVKHTGSPIGEEKVLPEPHESSAVKRAFL